VWLARIIRQSNHLACMILYGDCALVMWQPFVYTLTWSLDMCLLLILSKKGSLDIVHLLFTCFFSLCVEQSLPSYMQMKAKVGTSTIPFYAG
jgi:hypothetical protein